MTTPSPCVPIPSPLATKGEWRVWARQQREMLLTPNLSPSLIHQCANWPVFQQADELLITWPTKGELDVRPLVQAFQGAVYLPRITGPRQMVFHRFESDSTLVKGPHGILEPANDSLHWQPNSTQSTLLIAPALCVDTAGYRLGYGGGYFDTWLHAHQPLGQHSFTVASLVPSALIVKQLPHDPWDQRLDHLVTENGLTCYD